VRAVPVAVQRVVVVPLEIPADQIVDITVVAVVQPVGHAPDVRAIGRIRILPQLIARYAIELAGNQVAAVDVPVVVDIVGLVLPLVHRLIEVPEREQPVAVRIGQPAANMARDLGLIDPDVAVQIGMRVIDPRIDHGDRRARAACRPAPRLWGIDIGIGHVVGLMQIPLLAEVWIAGSSGDAAIRRRVEFKNRLQIHGIRQRSQQVPRL
jgi:hypothetical protein